MWFFSLENDFIEWARRTRMGCIFCQILSGQIPSKRLSESEHCIAILDAFPLAAGHALVISKRHCPKIQDLDRTEVSDLFAMVQVMASRIESAMSADAMIIVHNGPDAGQVIPHVHVHVIPRTAGDRAGHIPDLFRGSAAEAPGYDADALHALLKDND